MSFSQLSQEGNMLGFLVQDKKHSLCATEDTAVLVKVKLEKNGSDSVQVLSNLKRKSGMALDVASLIADTERRKSKVALVMPLQEFELVSVTVPPVSKEAIAKMLPYSLAKMLDVPVTNYIYDWQIAQKFKDRYEITVFLYSAENFEHYRSELLSRKKELTWFEPDVFAACAYLHNRDPSAAKNSYLCLLTWESSVSIAICENRRITFVRSIDMIMPEGEPNELTGSTDEKTAAPLNAEETDAASTETIYPEETDVIADTAGTVEIEEIEDIEIDDFIVEKDDSIIPVIEAIEVKENRTNFFGDNSESSDILTGFGIHESSSEAVFASEDIYDEEPTLEEPNQSIGLEPDPWALYFENLSLEIMRTRDYHISVLKGEPIQDIYIGGIEHCSSVVIQALRETHDVNVYSFPPATIDAECSQTLAAICVGAHIR